MTPPIENNAVTVYQATNVQQFSPQNEAWQLWKEKLEIHFCEINCSDDNIKKAILLKSIGAAPYAVLHSLCSPESPVSKTFKALCEMLHTYYTPPMIIFRERKLFYSAKKEDSETVSEWYARTKKLALNCKFGTNLEAFLLDRFIMGLPDKIFEKLCEEDEKLKLDEALRKALIMEMKLSNKSEDNTSVNYINKSKAGNKKMQNSKSSSNNSKSHKNNNSNKNKQQNKGNTCKHCGWRNHQSNECRYKESRCNICKKVGHLASTCRDKNKSVNYVSDNINQNNNNENSNNQNFCIYSISSGNSAAYYYLSVKLDGRQMKVACDSGSPCSLISITLFEKLNKNVSLTKCSLPYVDYSGNAIQVMGEYLATIEYNGTIRKLNVVVTDTNNMPLLGCDFLRLFNFDLVQTVKAIDLKCNIEDITSSLKRDYSEVFKNELGTYKLAWKKKVEINLRELINMDVLEPVDNADWGTPLVPILKPNGDLRICGDYKVTINKHLIDFHYPLPLIEDIFASLQGGQLFTKLDLSNAYSQLVLDEDSQRLCTWSTHIGCFKMKRLPFGVKPAAAIFQKTMENLLRNVPFVVVYQDDITVSGKDLAEHVRNLRSVLCKLQSAGLRLNVSKCEFFKAQVSYLGFKIDKDGLSKTTERISSVLQAPIPKNVSELRAFVGHHDFEQNYEEKSYICHIKAENALSINFKDIVRETRRDPILSK
ncbi:uncharacterized protein K02A2.6-like, partial [Rhagoletis pomonella]|uniref:uncharacterized protein K02A2.6-like n=1 Tax=Rhagoletis pomonella TaxID=28610 RepID=UPI0017856AB6